MASLSDKITQQIQGMSEDISFGYGQLAISGQEFQAAAKVMERLQKKGLIRKLSKGIFYKPKITVFGEKVPDEQDTLKPYLYRDGQRLAYVTGNYLYSQMGLTTQIPVVIQIASRDRRIFINRGTVKATAVKSYVDVTENNYQVLGFLDAMKDLKQIPDNDVTASVRFFKKQVGQMNETQRVELIGYALKYPPRVRALLGAILAAMGQKKEIQQLRDSLNPLTIFELGIDEKLLQNVPEWNIR
jgi:hypothetical protein